MFTLVWPKVHFVDGRWVFLAQVSGKMVEWDLSEEDAMGLAESILSSHKWKAKREREQAAA
jgi:hypothetical protein